VDPLSAEDIAARLGAAPAAAGLPARVPPSFGAALHDAAASSPRWAGPLAANYLRDGPVDRARILGGRDALHAPLHHPLDLDRLPRTAAALARLIARLDAAGVPADAALGAPDLAARFAARPTWAALFAHSYFGGFQPPLFGREADLARIAHEVADGASLDAALDPVLASALTHELAHGHADRDVIQPPYLDEAIVLWMTTGVTPASTWPDGSGEHVVPGAPRLAEVGAALAREVGPDALLRAHFGVVPWSSVLPPGLRGALRALGRARFAAAPAGHLLGEPHHPEPWLRLLAHAHDPTRPGPLPRVPADRDATPDEDDRAWTMGALRGLCVVSTLVDGAFRLETRAPGEVRVDPARGALQRARKPDEIGFGPAEAWLPWRALPGLPRRPFTLRIDDPTDLAEAAAALGA
jgi:hypothetical protein